MTLVRDPVARTVSAFFRSFPFSFPELDPRILTHPGATPGLAGLFLGEWLYGHRFARAWFEREVRSVFGIDVYATPFPRQQGYAIYAGPTHDLLVICCEDFDRCGSRALHEFLGVDGLVLSPANRTQDRAYAAARDRFLATLRLPAAYLDEMYGSNLATHFYGDAERAAFRARWAPR